MAFKKTDLSSVMHYSTFTALGDFNAIFYKMLSFLHKQLCFNAYCFVIIRPIFMYLCIYVEVVLKRCCFRILPSQIFECKIVFPFVIVVLPMTK